MHAGQDCIKTARLTCPQPLAQVDRSQASELLRSLRQSVSSEAPGVVGLMGWDVAGAPSLVSSCVVY